MKLNVSEINTFVWFAKAYVCKKLVFWAHENE